LRLKELMASHFYDLDNAVREGTAKIAWCSSVGPAELLRSLGFLVYFPENHAALLGATRKANDYIPAANAIGYSPEICSYLTSDVGASIRGETPLSGAYPGITQTPPPDVLVYNTNQCRAVKDWFQWYSRKYRVPCLGVESFRQLDEVSALHVAAISSQIQQLIPPLQNISGARFDIDCLRETLELSRQCSELWRQVLETAAHLPSPFTFFDGTIHMGPAVIARGTQSAVDYYIFLLAELQQRIENGVAAVDQEKCRIYWEGMPIWGKLRELAALFLRLKTCIVASTYCNSWIFSDLDPRDPFESMARAYTELFITRTDACKERYIHKMVEFYRIDGILFHEAKTCPDNSNSLYGMPQRLYQQLGIPTMVIHGDLNDLRLFSEEQAVTRLEAFIEQILG
jgi:benzoyl-CoA reductase/2-hydroxyglutaryl-CoA dehydratase subunit BcrC/BadD/HgdB